MRAMKDSGIEWIGQIPQEWNLERLKFHADFNPATELPVLADEEDVSFVPMDHLKSGFHIQSMVPYSKVKKGYVCFADGDVLMAKVTPCLENGNLAIAENLHEGVGFGSTEINVMRCKTIANRFLFYLLQCPTYIEKAKYNMYGVAGLKRLDPKFIPNSYFPIPSEEEQIRIASYVDAKCAEIDALIAAKEKTNALLKERRQSIIYEAVTKGLNPDAPMKDSGIEWIGQIPGNWTTWRMKHLASEPLQYGANATGVEFREDIPRYVRITDITADRKLSNDGKQSLETDIAQDYMLEDGDILFARSGATSGKSFYYEDKYGPCCFAGYLINLRTDNRKALSKFLYYYTLTQAYENWTQQIFIQATIQNISADKYNNLWFAIPGSLEEQADIVAYLDQRCSEMDELISANEATIQKLKEYRQSIIYEAVTGKIEV